MLILGTFQNTSYSIYLDKGLLSDKTLLSSHIKDSQALIVTHKSLINYSNVIKQQLSHIQCDEIFLEEGDKNKSFESLEKILSLLIQRKHRRSTTLIALGGGVIGDITGLASALYLRGVDCIYIPTSLLAQVDATLGGKCAINHPLGKNLIGTFYHPRCIFIDTLTLVTLSEREFKAGLAEVVKHAIALDQDFFHWLQAHADKIKQRDQDTLITLIYKSLNIKKRVVEQDEKDLLGKRALLNFGHTFGHALEYSTAHDLLHGEAVTIGMQIAINISLQLGLLRNEDKQQILALFSTLGLSSSCPKQLQLSELKEWLQRDKKNTNSNLQMILLEKIGHAVLREVDWKQIDSCF